MSEPKQPQIEVANAPHFVVSGFSMSAAANHILLMATRMVPLVGVDGPAGAGLEPAVSIHMSPQTAKELMVLLADVVAKHEAEWGALRTPFIDERGKK